MTSIFVALSFSNRIWKEKDSQSLGLYNKAHASASLRGCSKASKLKMCVAGRDDLFLDDL